MSRQNGEAVPLTPRVFETLLFLVQNNGVVLDKERLMEAVWPDSIVEENNLSQNISSLRRILGETPGSHRYIVTVPGRGYRFVAEVRTPTESVMVDPDAAPPLMPPPARNPYPVLLAGLGVLVIGLIAFFLWPGQARKREKMAAAPVISEKSIAVLPFDNLSRDPENAYFTDGIKDEILTRLSKISALKVISRTSTQKFKSAPENVREIARQLGVANILEGSVQKSGETVRVTVQLINTQSDTHLWAETYDRKLTDMFEVESEIAQRIATSLEAALSAPEKQAMAARPTENVEAYQTYLKGRYYWNKRTDDAFARAGEYFQRAIAIDPKYAPAYSGLSDAYQFVAFNSPARAELYAKAKAAAQKALELDPTLAEPHASLGLIAMNYDWDWPAAEREFRRAIELNPNYATAHHWYAEYLIALDRADDSLAEIKRARELDPLSLIINTDIGKILYYARRYDEAIAQLQETRKIDPDFEQTQIWLGSVYATTGRYDAAIAAFRRIPENAWTKGWLAYTYGISGRQEEAKNILAELQNHALEKPVDPHIELCVYLGLGEKDAAFAALEKEFEMRSVGMTSLKVNPWYDSLRDDPRFLSLLQRTNLAP